MRISILILFLIGFVAVNAQTEIIAQPGEYVEAQNYGGRVEFKRFLQQEINYPEKALANKIEGTVELAFVVDSKSGKTSRLEVKKSVSPELDAEAIRLYKLLKFVPSYYKGDRMTTYSTLKFKFSIKSYKRYCKKRGYKTAGINYEEMDTSNVVYQDNQVKYKPRMVFKDTLENISTFIQKNIKYPEGTLRLNITGVVKLFFVVEPTGRITNIKVLKDVGGGATNEAIRILRLSKWEAGKRDGKKVRVSKQFKVNFNLSNEPGMDVLPNNY
ncbi:MAG: energy transducer TonB [Flavobacteriales bacterium]|nr:energy transducer TonB [Flavobacteriales bacterium]